MFALKPRIDIIARMLLIAVLLFNALGTSAASARIQGENEGTSPANSTEDLANSMTLGMAEAPRNEQVPILSEEIAKQAQKHSQDMLGKVADYVQDNPLTAMGIAVVFIGAFFSGGLARNSCDRASGKI